MQEKNNEIVGFGADLWNCGKKEKEKKSSQFLSFDGHAMALGLEGSCLFLGAKVP